MFSMSRRSMVSASMTDTVLGVSLIDIGLSVALTVTESKKRRGASGRGSSPLSASSSSAAWPGIAAGGSATSSGAGAGAVDDWASTARPAARARSSTTISTAATRPFPSPDD